LGEPYTIREKSSRNEFPGYLNSLKKETSSQRQFKEYSLQNTTFPDILMVIITPAG